MTTQIKVILATVKRTSWPTIGSMKFYTSNFKFIVNKLKSKAWKKNIDTRVEIANNTITWYKIGQRNDVIFYLDDEKNRCKVLATELFFEEV